MATVLRRRTIAANRITGTETIMMRNAADNPAVMGKPRRTFTASDSRRLVVRARAATEIPTPIGMSSANPIQTIRIVQSEMRSGMGNEANTTAATLGATTPNRRIGQATAPATTTVSKVCARSLV